MHLKFQIDRIANINKNLDRISMQDQIFIIIGESWYNVKHSPISSDIKMWEKCFEAGYALEFKDSKLRIFYNKFHSELLKLTLTIPVVNYHFNAQYYCIMLKEFVKPQLYAALIIEQPKVAISDTLPTDNKLSPTSNESSDIKHPEISVVNGSLESSRRPEISVVNGSHQLQVESQLQYQIEKMIVTKKQSQLRTAYFFIMINDKWCTIDEPLSQSDIKLWINCVESKHIITVNTKSLILNTTNRMNFEYTIRPCPLRDVTCMCEKSVYDTYRVTLGKIPLVSSRYVESSTNALPKDSDVRMQLSPTSISLSPTTSVSGSIISDTTPVESAETPIDWQKRALDTEKLVNNLLIISEITHPDELETQLIMSYLQQKTLTDDAILFLNIIAILTQVKIEIEADNLTQTVTVTKGNKITTTKTKHTKRCEKCFSAHVTKDEFDALIRDLAAKAIALVPSDDVNKFIADLVKLR